MRIYKSTRTILGDYVSLNDSSVVLMILNIKFGSLGVSSQQHYMTDLLPNSISTETPKNSDSPTLPIPSPAPPKNHPPFPERPPPPHPLTYLKSKQPLGGLGGPTYTGGRNILGVRRRKISQE